MTTTSSTLGLLTYSDCPDLSSGDQHFLDELSNRGIAAEPVCWDRSDVDWSQYTDLIIRSTWNYHEQPAAFSQFIDRIDRSETRLWNPADCVRWNMRKTYLANLADRGINVIPTQYLESPVPGDLKQILRGHKSPSIVLKPVVGAGAYHMARLAADRDIPDSDWLARHEQWMVQPFYPDVVEKGEWSLIFFGKQFSHAVLKTSAQDDYRVQTEHGGDVQSARPEQRVIDWAGEALNAVPHDWIYGRVDGVVRDQQFYLMELELIEPNLYLETAESAVERFADVVVNELSIHREERPSC